MSVDLINRSELLERSMPAREFARNCPDLHVVSVNSVRRAPTVDAEPVRHGRWIPNSDDDMDEGMWHCSECKHEIYADLSLIKEVQEQGYALYCEHCGAKMEVKNASN